MTKKPKENSQRFAFFGTSRIAVGILNELEKTGFLPVLVITAPDMARGRGMKLSPPPTKTWAESRSIPVLQPEKLDSDFLYQLRTTDYALFIIVDYGKILPKEVLDLPKRGCLNVHFSLLPRYRGASPIRSAILNDDKNVGTSIILLDEKLDRGPIVAQKRFDIQRWPPKASELETTMIYHSGKLLAQILPEWAAGRIDAREQNHDIATYSEKFSKEDGLLDLNDNPYQNLLKIRALEGWPGTYTFFERTGKKIRVQILDAHLENGQLVIDRVKPEGKKEMLYADFLRSGVSAISH